MSMDLEEQYPKIDWNKPIKVSVPRLGSGLGCPRCIATYGLRGVDVTGLPQTPQEFEAHLSSYHG